MNKMHLREAMYLGISLMLGSLMAFPACAGKERNLPSEERTQQQSPMTRAQACLRLGALYVDEEQYVEALPYLKEATEKNNKLAAAWYYLGVVHHCGPDGIKDDAKAYSYFCLASTMGEARGTVSMASFLMRGNGGVPINERKAFELYEQAAKLGNDQAKLNLALFYDEGLGGIQQDRQKAKAIYEALAAKNNAKALYNLGMLYVDEDSGMMDVASGILYFKRACNLENPLPDAMFQLGRVYQKAARNYPGFEHIGVSRHIVVDCFRDAAERGDRRAALELSYLLLCDEDTIGAKDYFEKLSKSAEKTERKRAQAVLQEFKKPKDQRRLTVYLDDPNHQQQRIAP